MIRRYPRDYERYRTLHQNRFPTFRDYLIHIGRIELPSRPVGLETPRGTIRARPNQLDLQYFPMNTLRQVRFPKTNRYREEMRWVYIPPPQIVFENVIVPPAAEPA